MRAVTAIALVFLLQSTVAREIASGAPENAPEPIAAADTGIDVIDAATGSLGDAIGSPCTLICRKAIS